MAYLTGGGIAAAALKRLGVSHLFTLCGGHIQDIYNGCLDQGIRVVDVRHEQTAAHAADGWARVTGEVGVCAVTAGPGVTGTVTAAANALRAQVPMVVIGGQAARSYGPLGGQDRGGLQELNAVELMRPVTKWAVSVPETHRVAEYLQSAFRVARSGVPGPVFLEMPLDVLINMVDESDVIAYEGSRTDAVVMGDPRHTRAAADLLRAAQRPVLIVGGQHRFSPYRGALMSFVESVPAPTFLNGMARGSLPPGQRSVFRRCRSEALERADLVAVVGAPLDFRLGYGEKIPADARVIQVDLDGAEIGRNRKVDVGIVSDSGAALAQLTELLAPDRLDFSSWLTEVGALEQARIERTAAETVSDETPINPLRLAAELNRFVDDRTIVIGDGGDFVATASYILDIRGPGNWMDPGPLGTLGVGPGYAMAAKLARPDARVLLALGDGSFGFNGMEFEAMARQRIPVVGVIGNDACWSQIYRGQAAFYGQDRCVATRLNYARYDKMVEALGGHGEFVERPGDIAPALQRALDSGLPALVNVIIGGSDFRKGSVSV